MLLWQAIKFYHSFVGWARIKSPQDLKLRGWEFTAAYVYTAVDAIPRRAKRFCYEPCKFVFA